MEIRDGLGGVARGGDDGRLRATWRIVISSLVAYACLFTGVIIVLSLLPSIGLPRQAPYTLTGNGLVSLIAAALTLVVAARVDSRAITEYGFQFSRRWWADLAAGLVVGFVAAAISVLVGLVLGYGEIVETFSDGDSGSFFLLILLTLIGMVGIVFFEETLFRGVLVKNFAEGFSSRTTSPKVAVIVAVLVSTLLFVPSHFLGGITMEGESLAVASIGFSLMGLWWGIAYALTGRLALPLGIHLAYNATNAVVFAPTEAFATGYATLLRLDFVKGGYFNSFEYDVVVFSVGILLVGVWVYVTRGEISVDERLARWTADEADATVGNPSRGTSLPDD